MITWSDDSIRETDVATRKLLTLHGAFHPKSSTLKLYSRRQDGGRGLISVKQAVQGEELSLKSYVQSRANTDELLSECLSVITTKEPAADDDGATDWRDRPLHSTYHCQISEVCDAEKTYQWLKKCDLTAKTEALILAAQEQALPTRQIQTQIYNIRTDASCRLCKQAPESIQHIISGCKQLAGSAYTERHNHVAGMVYRSLCAQYDLSQPHYWWEIPDKVNENDQVKILWDFYIHTDKHVLANQPDIVVVNKSDKRAIIIDIALQCQMTAT